MDLIRKTNIDFLGKRHICFALSVILLAVAAWSLGTGVNKGIDFAGGTEIQVKFASAPRIDDLRSRITDLDVGDVTLQSIGAPEDQEFLIRVGSTEPSGRAHAQEIPEAGGENPIEEPAVPLEESSVQEEAPAAQPADEATSAEAQAGGEAPVEGESAGEDLAAPEAFGEPRTAIPPESSGSVDLQADESEQARVYHAVLSALREITGDEAADKVDLNVAGEQEIARALAARPGGADQARDLAAAIAAYRTGHAGMFHNFDELDQVEGMTPEVVEYLEQNAYLGSFTIRRVDFVGPKVGRELAEKAFLAMIFALAGMLVYITLRFRKLGFALGGIMALVHDGVISAGVYNLWGGQFDLTIVAAILTLLGYSINDTIVIFDRVRENLRAMRGTNIIQVFNDSINQTLSRTILTSLTTLLVVLCLFLFGGETIHGFAFVLMFGIIIGTYSTIFIASPVVILYQSWFEGRRANARARSSAPASKASRGRRKAAGRR